MDAQIESAIISATVSAIVSVMVAAVSPPIAHHLWKKQKVKEEQVATAQRFRVLLAEMVTHSNLPNFSMRSPEHQKAYVAQRFDFHATLFTVEILFRKKRTQELARIVNADSQEALGHGVELQALLYQEAFNLPKTPTLKQVRPFSHNP